MSIKRKPFIVVENVYGGGKYAVELIAGVRDRLLALDLGCEVKEHECPDATRAVLMGFHPLAQMHMFGACPQADFYLGLKATAAVSAEIFQDINNGNLVLCKHGTLAQRTYLELLDQDWTGGGFYYVDAHARGAGSGRKISPDITVFIQTDLDEMRDEVESRLEEIMRNMEDKIAAARFVAHVRSLDLEKQEQIYLKALDFTIGRSMIVNAADGADFNVKAVLSLVQKLL